MIKVNTKFSLFLKKTAMMAYGTRGYICFTHNPQHWIYLSGQSEVQADLLMKAVSYLYSTTELIGQ
jgi:hypothetical protein